MVRLTYVHACTDQHVLIGLIKNEITFAGRPGFGVALERLATPEPSLEVLILCRSQYMYWYWGNFLLPVRWTVRHERGLVQPSQLHA